MFVMFVILLRFVCLKFRLKRIRATTGSAVARPAAFAWNAKKPVVSPDRETTGLQAAAVPLRLEALVFRRTNGSPAYARLFGRSADRQPRAPDIEGQP
ncbi:hypothetical protein ACF3MZ_31240 [Paenibacillaceae bacterium WGS1546]|uniref:hypothetical protein n=1 Tax=Cohnella sp. WGS1546 TaxID=3366810 RepID=UPI00372D3A7C